MSIIGQDIETMKRLIPLALTLAAFAVSAQKIDLNVGIGVNAADQEVSVNHSLSSLVFFIEPGIRLGNRSQIRYSLEPGVKFEGEVEQTSLPPQKFGANFLINQYLKTLYSLGAGITYAGAGYLLHYQRPYDTVVNEQGGVISTARFNQFGHGLGAYFGVQLAKVNIEGSYHHVFGTFRNFGAVKVGYKIF